MDTSDLFSYILLFFIFLRGIMSVTDFDELKARLVERLKRYVLKCFSENDLTDHMKFIVENVTERRCNLVDIIDGWETPAHEYMDLPPEEFLTYRVSYNHITYHFKCEKIHVYLNGDFIIVETGEKEEKRRIYMMVDFDEEDIDVFLLEEEK